MEYFFEKVWRAFSFIWAAIKMAFQDKDLFIPSLLSLAVNGLYVALILIVLSATNTMWLLGFTAEDVEGLKATGRLLRDGPSVSLQEEMDQKIAEDERAAEARRSPGGGEGAAAAAPVVTESRDESAKETARHRRYMQGIFIALVIFGSYVITYVFGAMTVSLVYDFLSGKDARIGDAFAVTMKRLPGLLLLALVSTVVALFAQAARGKDKKNVVGAIIAGVIEQLWTIASFLILPGMVIHRLTLWQGLKRAKEVAAKNLLVVAVGEIGVGLVTNVIVFLGVAGGLIVGFFTYGAVPRPFYIPVGVGGFVVLLTIAFCVYVRQAYYTCLYVNAVESAQLGRRAPVRGPLAAALG